MRCPRIVSVLLLIPVITHAQVTSFTDSSFAQEYHVAYPLPGDSREAAVRSITADQNDNIWIATKYGILVRKHAATNWVAPVKLDNPGPAYAVATHSNGDVFMGTWNGLYRNTNKGVQLITGTEGPIASICSASEGLYAAGPKGIWFWDGRSCSKLNYPIARSVRKIISDQHKGIWVGTDVGLYHCTPNGMQQFVDTSYLASAYVKGISLDELGQVWTGGLGGISILANGRRNRQIQPADGLPSRFVNCISRSANGTMWIGTEMGLVRFSQNGAHSLLFSRRWLLDDQVNDIAFDAAGNAWVATAKGVSAIMKSAMTLSAKQDYFYDILMKRHIRAPWIAGQCHLDTPGDVNSWQPEDDDNDGEFTGNYLAMESFRYAVTKSTDAREKAKKAYHFLQQLEEITGGDGYFARTMVPPDWAGKVHDPNRQYTPAEIAEELVKDPRYKPLEIRWHTSADGKWLWKGDASSDEWCGHMLGYFFYYELAADEAEKEQVRKHVSRLLDHLIAHDFNMHDKDGSPTHWSVWSPNLLNRDPEWQPDQNQNSMEILAFLKFGFYITGQKKYQDHYLRLINKEHYLENMGRVTAQNPAWFIYYDVTMQAYLYPIFLHCEKDPKLLQFYRDHLETWMNRRRMDQNPLINFLYCYASGKKQELTASVNFLTDTPLDLVDWTIDHTRREDIKLVNRPVLDELQVNELPPPSIRQVVRWDKNPWTATGGYPNMEREPVFWLLPYWMGRYLNMIR